MNLLDKDGKVLADSSVVWQRRSTLSASPSNVLLGNHQSRVFLHSSIDNTNFLRVKSVPKGVEASMVSPTELVVRKQSSNIVVEDGLIIVETDSAKYPELKITVVGISDYP